jgi:anti-sigma regulatory factor (Ser/Thr protein kinase)
MDLAVTARVRSAQQRYVIDDSSKVGEARRAAQTIASFEFTAEIAGKVAIAATELANNLLLHASGGELLVQALGDDDAAVVELLAIDRGPGMDNIERRLRTDSTAGTPGTGLGAVRRLATEFDIHSVPGEGTIVMARFGTASGTRHGAMNIASKAKSSAAMPGACEDSALPFRRGRSRPRHFCGRSGASAVDAFPWALRRHRKPWCEPTGSCRRLWRRGGLRPLVGDKVSYAGVGNISGTLISVGKSQGLVSQNGTLGLHQRRTHQFEYQREPGALLIMHSDGVSARWDLKNRADLLTRHPAIIAAALYRDHGRERDDATVVVVS